MSLLQLKNIHKRHLLWAKLFGICLFIHLVFLFWIFCVYRDNSYMLSLSINKNLDYSAPIMFLALGSANATKDKSLNAPKATKTSAHPIKKQTTVVQKTSSPKPTTVAAAIPKKEETKKETPPVTKKTDAVKKEVVKADAKVDVKQPEPIKQEVAQKSDVKKKEKPAPIAQAIDTQQTIVPIIPENVHISHNYREVEALRKQAQLQKELVQTWKPPIGVSPDCMCEISFFVTSKGKVENIKMVKSSGVLMFDISARQALCAMKMPQWTYGKPFTINFNQ